ncbi:MAG: ribose-phosphate pyrophosphokinase [Deltaproteobacteria bacterium]|nr:ribose-phosphate pyrophosphokinase [Deltaproteobacteria bacterium]MBI3391265.1 ribose-phosphate pyrophosphokinase [Deltaproteobacteria bacterium]
MRSRVRDEIQVFAGNSNLALAREVCQHLNVPLGKAEVRRFSDGEINVKISDNVRGSDVFVLQSTCTPVNDNLMELLLMLDAFRRASAKRVTAVIPYFGYARQDRKVDPRVPISAKLVADLITTSGASRVLTLDLHAGQIQGFFNIPVDNLFATRVLLKYVRDRLPGDGVCVVSPDPGGVERARAFAKHINAGLAIIDKRRPRPNVVAEMRVVGEVEGQKTIIVDDIVDTAGTLAAAAKALKDAGATEVYACCTHPVLSGPAIERVEQSVLRELIVTDTIPLSEPAQRCGKVKVLSVAQLLGSAIKRTHDEESVSSLFD